METFCYKDKDTSSSDIGSRCRKIVKAVNIAMRGVVHAIKQFRRKVKAQAKKRLIFAKEANSVKDALVVYVTGLLIQDFDLAFEAADTACFVILSSVFDPAIATA